MAITERVTTRHEVERQARVLGLIDPRQSIRFRQVSPLVEAIVKFDQLLAKTVNGHAQMTRTHRRVRLDKYEENGNIIRTVVIPRHLDRDGNWYCSNVALIHHPVARLLQVEGGPKQGYRTYIEVHPSLEDPVSHFVLWEPEVGSPVVTPGDGTQHRLFEEIGAYAQPVPVL